jgi:hypothetical protein
MAQQVVNGGFRFVNEAGLLVNLQDLGQGPSTWTPGSTIIDPVPLSPTLADKYSIVSWQISFQGGYFYTAARSFGKLPKVIGGLVRTPQQTQGAGPGALNPFTAAALPLATDLSLLSVLWDGDQDPMFPVAPVVGPIPSVPTVGGLTLQVPLVIASGEGVAIGLWITPSLTQNLQIFITNATYTVNYDDGKP